MQMINTWAPMLNQMIVGMNEAMDKIFFKVPAYKSHSKLARCTEIVYI